MLKTNKLTKEMLMNDYGITSVSEDGKHIIKGDKEISQHLVCQYFRINIRNKAEYDATPKEKRTKHTACGSLTVHRVVYAWFHGEVPANLVVDHIDANKINNALSNLQLITQNENMAKYSKDLNNTLIECDITRPRSYYEEKLEAHVRAAKRLRAKLRYYDANKV